MNPTVTTTPDGLGGMWVYAGPALLGRVFPERYEGMPAQAVPGCGWYGKRTGWRNPAKLFPTAAEALVFVTAVAS